MNNSYKYVIENGPNLKGDVMIINWEYLSTSIILITLPFLFMTALFILTTLPNITSVIAVSTAILGMWEIITIDTLTVKDDNGESMSPITFYSVTPLKSKVKKK